MKKYTNEEVIRVISETKSFDFADMMASEDFVDPMTARLLFDIRVKTKTLNAHLGIKEKKKKSSNDEDSGVMEPM